MGKHKRKRRDKSIDELNKRLRELEKRLYSHYVDTDENETGSKRLRSRSRSTHRQSRHSRARKSMTPRYRSSSSRRSVPTYSCSISPRGDVELKKKEGEANVEEVRAPIPEITPENKHDNNSLPAGIEGLLGQEGTVTANNSIELHESLVKRWTAILQNGLNSDTRSDIIKKHDPPKNCELLVPPKLNEEVVAAMNESGIKRDKRIECQQVALAAAITSIGEILNTMIVKQESVQYIETLSDSARLLCDIYHEKSTTRRSLILPGLNKDMKELMEKTLISEYLFGDKLQDKVNTCKAIKKSGQELKNTQVQPRVTKPKIPLNYRGPQRPHVLRPSGQKPKPKRATYHVTRASTRPRRSPRRQHHPRRQERR